MANENNALLEAIDKLTEAVDGLEDAVKAHADAETKAKVTECLAQVQKGLDACLRCSQNLAAGLRSLRWRSLRAR